MYEIGHFVVASYKMLVELFDNYEFDDLVIKVDVVSDCRDSYQEN